MKKEEYYRVAISNASPFCSCESGSRARRDGYDRCADCQPAYIGLTEIRLDYADETVGYFDTRQEAEAAKAALTSISYPYEG